MSYKVGDGIEITLTFTDKSGVAGDPTTQTCTARKPDGTEIPVALTRQAQGDFVGDLVFDQAGRWYISGVGAGVIAAADDVSIVVEELRA